MKIEGIKQLLENVEMKVLGVPFRMRVEHDNKNPAGRVFLQVAYEAECSHSGEVKEWKGRKWYLSDHMTEDEVIKTGYAAFEAAVKHEVMEGYKVNGVILFNPHINYRELLEVSHREIFRTER